MGYASEIGKALAWFEDAGVDSWNFAVLGSGGMVNHDRPRGREEAVRAGGWAWAQNREGRNVYLRPARGAAWPVVFLDDITRTTARRISYKYASLSVETSRDNFQVWIRCAHPLTEITRMAVQKALAHRIGADPRSISGDHFGRAPGFRNQKPERGGFVVTVTASTRDASLDPTPHLSATTPTPTASQDLPLPMGGACVLEFFAVVVTKLS